MKPWVGMTVQPLDSNLANYLNIQNNIGVMVTSVDMESPAAKTGIKEGDIIISIDGWNITDIDTYQLKMNDISVDQSIVVEINRKGSMLSLSLTAIRFPLDRALDLAKQRLGIAVSGLNKQTRAKYGIQASKGVLIINIRRGTHLDRIGVRPGDIIHQIDEERVEDMDDFKAALVKYREKSSLLMLIQRDAHLYHINVIMKENG